MEGVLEEPFGCAPQRFCWPAGSVLWACLVMVSLWASRYNQAHLVLYKQATNRAFNLYNYVFLLTCWGGACGIYLVLPSYPNDLDLKLQLLFTNVIDYHGAYQELGNK